MASSDLPRVQYRPGSGGAVYAVVLGLVATAAFYSQSNLLFVAVGLMIGGLVFAVLWAWLSLRGLRVRRSTPPRVSAGDPLVLRYRLDNHGGLPAFAVVLRERPADDPAADGAPGRPRRLGGAPVTWALHVGGRRGVRMQSRCRPRRRGVLALSGLTLTSTFPFGIVRKTLTFDLPASLLVLPRLYRLDPDLAGRLVRGADGDEGPGRSAGGDDEFFGLRAYRPGDRPRAIDWKRSARGAGLVVRERTRARPPALSVRLDLSHPFDEARGDDADERFVLEERAISLAGSLLTEAHRAGLRVDLRIDGHGSPAAVAPGHGQQLAAMLASLARVQASPVGRGGDAGRGSASSAAPGAGAVVVWTGPSSAPPPRHGDRGGVVTLLGAADFKRHLAAAARGGGVGGGAGGPSP